MRFVCTDQHRRAAVRAYKDKNGQGLSLNGIDFLEVEEGKHDLRLRFLKDLDDAAEMEKRPDKYKIDGGERIRDVQVRQVKKLADDELLLTVDPIGDFSAYTLKLEADWTKNWFDPRLLEVEFVFRIECLTDACAPEPPPPPVPLVADGLDYLAKDYASFRRLMLDRMAALAPDWQARSVADLGMALVEMLAYVGDYLSYQQDAIAAEAYLDTARRRVSVRRHARLVDYAMHDGCNARTWVQVQVNGQVTLPAGTGFVTRIDGEPLALPLTSDALRQALSEARAEMFLAMHGARLYKKHNRMEFYTWGDRECRLPAGATAATLIGSYPSLKPGDVVLLAERAPEGRCHPVRLTTVNPHAADPLGVSVLKTARVPDDPGTGNAPLALTEIEWAEADALPFDLCISCEGDDEPSAAVLGNIVLADHGWPVDEPLPVVPEPRPVLPRRASNGESIGPVVRYRPRLSLRGVTCREDDSLPGSPQAVGLPASALLFQQPDKALPQMQLVDQNGVAWDPRRDLLDSDGDAERFVPEIETDGTILPRFGDGTYGRTPPVGTTFTARLRLGNGRRGNIGSGVLAHLVSNDSGLIQLVTGVTNPLPAQGGQDPESVADVRRKAPYAYRRSERAVRPEDYVEMALRHPEVLGAAAQLRWTGSWYTVFLAVDRRGGGRIDPDFEAELRRHLDRYRMAGHDLEITDPIDVALSVALVACLKPNASRPAVLAELRRRLLARRLPGEGSAFFHPDHFSFGQPVVLSALVAALDGTPGLASVNITCFERMDGADPDSLANGVIHVAWCEIARLDGDPNYPEHGILRITLGGGL